MKRFIAVLICIFMLVSLLPAFAFAQEGAGDDPAMQEGGEGGNNGEGADPSLTLAKDPTLTQPAELEKKIEQPAELEKKDLQLGETEQKLVQSEEPEKKLEQKLDPIVLTDNGEDGQQNGGGEPTATYSVTVSNDGNGTGSANPASGATGTEVTLSAVPNDGYLFKGWEVVSGGVTIANNQFTIGSSHVEVKAIFEAAVQPTDGDGGEPKDGGNTPTYKVTVTGGSGGGDYAEGAAVTIKANTLEANKRFKGWTWTEVESLTFTSGSKDSVEATFTMPANKVSLTATYEELKYSISVSPSELNFESAQEGYTVPAAQTVTVTNTGTQRVTLTQPMAGAYYDIGTIASTALEAGETATFTVTPKAGLNGKNDAYEETITVIATDTAGEDGESTSVSASVKASFTVTAPAHTPSTITVSDNKVAYGKSLTVKVSVSSALNYSGMLELRINGKNYGEPQDIGNDGEVTWKISASKSYGFKLGDNKIETVYIGAQDAASLLSVAATVKVTSACKPQPVCKPTHYCCGQNHFTGKCVTVRSGEDVTFKVELGCNESCQWYVNRGDGCGFVKIKGATCPTLTVKDVTHKQDGYRYRCVIRNCCETIRTPIYTLNVASGQLYTPKTGDSSGIGLAIAIAAMGVCLPAVRRREDRS